MTSNLVDRTGQDIVFLYPASLGLQRYKWADIKGKSLSMH